MPANLNPLFQWITSVLGLAAFAVTLFICVTGGQDLLVSVLKSIGVFFIVRLAAQFLSGLALAGGQRMIAGEMPSVPEEEGEPQ